MAETGGETRASTVCRSTSSKRPRGVSETRFSHPKARIVVYARRRHPRRRTSCPSLRPAESTKRVTRRTSDATIGIPRKRHCCSARRRLRPPVLSTVFAPRDDEAVEGYDDGHRSSCWPRPVRASARSAVTFSFVSFRIATETDNPTGVV